MASQDKIINTRLDLEEPLDDGQESEFTGATLSLDNAENGDRSPNVPVNTLPERPVDPNANVAQPPKSNATVVWQVPFFGRSIPDSKRFFADRDGAFERAVDICKPVILENLDGQFQGAWLLTEIDHWDNEKERFLILTEKSVLVIKFDFITLNIVEYRRIDLRALDCLIHGAIEYPQKSLMPGKHTDGLRCMWNKGQRIQFSQNWNPWSRDIPFITLTAHRLFYSEDVESKHHYDIGTFTTNMVNTVQTINANQTDPTARQCVIKEERIVIENYVGIVSVVHNAADLGFFKSRGRVSF